ncbi:MAG: class I SAM-dependent methyltransferase [Proteobacteria bacterium]|nr:class I SAM-dependent methyltransferase [Pseudomonadota bacterium]
MGKYTLSIPHDLALEMRDKYGLQWLIETGTYKGGTAFWAAQNFEQVISIEAFSRYYARCKARQTTEAHPNLELWFGDSRVMLADALAFAGGPALLWLDAHWCGDSVMAHAVGDECPLLQELAQVNADGRGHVLMIDDARLFIDGPDRPHDPAQWPDWETVQRLLEPRKVRVEMDVIIAEPNHG